MTATPEALKLAAELDADPTYSEVCKAAAAMLRQQHAELHRIERVGSCGTVDSWMSLADKQKREWFAATLHRDSEQCKLIRELESEVEALKAGQAEPFGYFRAEPFGWTDCAETDEGAIALYERPATHIPKETP
jgi:sugar (pentulose or hexulose) kinase